MQQAGDLLLLVGNLFHQGRQTQDSVFRKLQGLQIALEIDFFQGSQRQCQPPTLLRSLEEVTLRRNKMMSLQDCMQTVLGLSCQASHLFALCHQTTQFTNLLRGYPDPH